MTLGQFLRLTLTQAPGVAAIVEDRVYSDILPQAPEMPAVVFAEIASDEDEALDGPTGVSRTSVTVASWATTRAGAKALSLAVKAILSGYSGGAAGFEVQGMFLITRRDDFEDETGLYITHQDYEVWTSGVEGA